MVDTLGDRIKRYESVSNARLTPNMPVFIRVDGQAFHTYTRGMARPFSTRLSDSMEAAMTMTARKMSGFKLAYHQSDEVTFMLADTDSHETQGWFDYEVNKLVSITASMFTAYFNDDINTWGDPVAWKMPPAFFDARAFSVPAEDAPNVFIWRQRDWERNSLQMLARSVYSHAEMQGKRRDEIHEMLHAKGINWADLPGEQKNGTFYTGTGRYNTERHTYESVKALIEEKKDD